MAISQGYANSVTDVRVCSKRMNMFPGFPICHTVLAHFRENIFLVLMFRHSVGTIAVLVGIVSTWHWYSRGINPVVRGISPSGSLPICTTGQEVSVS